MLLAKPAILVASFVTLATLAAGCVYSPLPSSVVYGSSNITGSTSTNGAPLIQQFTTNTASTDRNTPVTFTVVAHSQSGQPLQYTWSATKGLLSSNTGMNVSWKPSAADSGIATITLTVTDGTNTQTGSLNLDIGAASVTAAPSTAPASAAPSASTAPSATPTAAVSTSPKPSASASTAATPAASASASAAATSAASPAATGAASPAASPATASSAAASPSPTKS